MLQNDHFIVFLGSISWQMVLEICFVQARVSLIVKGVQERSGSKQTCLHYDPCSDAHQRSYRDSCYNEVLRTGTFISLFRYNGAYFLCFCYVYQAWEWLHYNRVRYNGSARPVHRLILIVLLNSNLPIETFFFSQLFLKL